MKTLRSFCLAALAPVLSLFAMSSQLAAAENPPPLVILLTTEPIATEGGSEHGRFLVVRTGPTTNPLTVFYSLGGSAQNGVDYAELPGQVIIPEGASFASISVEAIDDALVEGSERAVANVVPSPTMGPIASYVVCWPFRGVVTLLDNDRPTNAPPQVAITNPPDGAVIPGPTDMLLTARAWDRDGRVESVEFFANGESLGIARNWVALRTAGLALENATSLGDLLPATDLFPDLQPQLLGENDGEILPHHFFRLKWEDAAPGDYELVAVATDNDGATTDSAPIKITVSEPPPPPIVNVVARDPIASEGAPSPLDPAALLQPDTATFVIRREGPTDRPLAVFYRLIGTAGNGVDYNELPTMATIPEGARQVEVVVRPIDDNLVEDTESVGVSLEAPVCPAIWPPSPDCYLVGRHGTARAMIRDNDTPTLNLPPRVEIVRPGDGSVFRGPADITIIADARDRDGRVVSVEFFEGETSLGIVNNPPILARPLDDGGTQPVLQPFVFNWQDVPPGHYVLRALASDNQGAKTWSCPVEIKVVEVQRPPVVTIHTIDGKAREQSPILAIPPDRALLQVQREGSVEGALKVFYQVGGTAGNGTDYVELSGEVEIPAGAKHADLVIDPTDDNLVEGDESVIVKLLPLHIDLLANTRPLNLPPYLVGEPSAARAVIHDDEPPPANQPPKIALVAPPDGSVLPKGADIKLAAVAGDSDGQVTQVEFFANNQSLGVVTPPDDTAALLERLYELLWDDVGVGTYELAAVATDDDGASTRSATVHIRVIDPCAGIHVAIVALDPMATEPTVWPPGILAPIMAPDTATIRISRRACDVSGPLEVHYQISGTAKNGEDYRELTGVAVIPANAWHVDVIVLPWDDQLVEATETVVLSLMSPPCLLGENGEPGPGCWIIHGPSSAVAFIRDNDTSENQLPKVALTQPANGASLPLHEPIEIVVKALDPDGWVPKVEFFANGVKIGEQEIVFIQEPEPGQEQTFTLSWSPHDTGEYLLVAKATDNNGGQSRSEPVRIKVADEYPLTKVIVLAVDPLAAEGGPNSNTDPAEPDTDPTMRNTATFMIHRTLNNEHPLEVSYHLGGVAKNGLDYQQLSGRVTIPAGEWCAPVVIRPIDDNLVEGSETVVIELGPVACPAIWPPSPQCYEVGEPARAVAFIRDNDENANRRPKIALTQPENGDVFTAPTDIELRAVAKDPDGWVGLVEFYSGKEKIGQVALNFIQPPPPGQEQVFEFKWLNAPVGGHVLTAVATDDRGAKSVSEPVFIKVVRPDGPPVVTVHARDAHAREGGPGTEPNTARFRVKRTGPVEGALTVFYTIGGTATNGEDYEELSGVVTIPAGRRSAPIVVTPIDDDLPERIESVLVRLIEPPTLAPVSILTEPGYIVGRPGRAAAYILDNDRPRPHCLELPDGLISLRLGGRDGVSYAVEVSNDLREWREIDCNTVRDGAIDFVDPDAAGQERRFYRLREAADDLRLEDELD